MTDEDKEKLDSIWESINQAIKYHKKYLDHEDESEYVHDIGCIDGLNEAYDIVREVFNV
jgi:hypothetical protein